LREKDADVKYEEKKYSLEDLAQKSKPYTL